MQELTKEKQALEKRLLERTKEKVEIRSDEFLKEKLRAKEEQYVEKERELERVWHSAGLLKSKYDDLKSKQKQMQDLLKESKQQSQHSQTSFYLELDTLKKQLKDS